MADDEADHPQALTARTRLEGRVAWPLLVGSFCLSVGWKRTSESVRGSERGLSLLNHIFASYIRSKQRILTRSPWRESMVVIKLKFCTINGIFFKVNLIALGSVNTIYNFRGRPNINGLVVGKSLIDHWMMVCKL